MSTKIMDEKKHFDAVDQFIDAGVKAFDFAGGGEPTLLPYLPKLMKHIRQRGAHYALITHGAVMSDAFPPMPITSVKVAGAKITLTITAPDGSEATINMELKGDDVTGDWSMPNDGSKIVGKKLP